VNLRLLFAAATLLVVLPFTINATAQKPSKPPKGGGAPANPAIAYSATSNNGYINLMVMDADGRNQTRLASGGHNLAPSWSPDSEWIAFGKSNSRLPGIYKVRPDGSGLCKVVGTNGAFPGAPTWSSSTDAAGRHWIIYVDTLAGQTRSDLFAVSATCNASDRRQLTDTPAASETFPAWSSGDLLAVTTQDPSVWESDIEVFDILFDATGPVDLAHRVNLTAAGPLATAGIGRPVWTLDGNEIIVIAGFQTFATDLWLLSLNAPDTALNLTNTAGFYEIDPTLSPDQMTLAFSGISEIYVADVSQPWSLGPPRVLLSPANGSARYPAWRPVH